MFKTLFLSACLAQAASAAPSNGEGKPSSGSKRLIVFGDSLSDNGTGTWEHSNHILPVTPPYYQHSWSNGPGWVELLAKKEKLEVHNYAQGGATLDNDVISGLIHPDPLVISNSTEEQINQFLSQDKPKKNDIFVLWAGANEAFSSPSGDFYGVEAVELIDEQIGTLHKNGAKKILLATLPELTFMPYIKSQPAAYQKYAAEYSRDYRTALLNLAKQWNKRIDVEVADVWKAANEIMAKAKKYGFDTSLLSTPCYTGNYHDFNGPVCSNPDKHFFWDFVHPSAAVIKILVKEFEDAFKKL